MRATPLSAAAVCMLLWLGPAGRASAQDRDPDMKIAGGGTLPTGWHARTDKNRPLADAKITTMGNGMHVTLGPAVILWRDRDKATGDSHAVGTFTQTQKPRHPGAHGLFIRGPHLADAQKPPTFSLLPGDRGVRGYRRAGRASP